MNSFRPIPKRPLANVGKEAWHAVSVIEDEFQGQLTHDSNRDVSKASTWIFTLPLYGNAQVAVSMNARKVSLLMRAKDLAGVTFQERLDGLAKVEKTYANPTKGVSSAVLGRHAPYLNPSATNSLLRVAPATGDITALMRIYLNTPKKATTAPLSTPSGRQ